MRTTEMVNTCPYTGLRSFTEDESLYFKGRDLQVDQVTALLEKNKFLMVTGASGEGKSSLIYAGLIPNARAGFFKARYSNWAVVDFRPERDPVGNMASAIAKEFDANPASVETELRRGYSSLVDLYTNTTFYTGDEGSGEDQSASPDIKERKRKAANLMIIVDQFEEFFTNPENFFNEKASTDSQIVVNLILETARIAIARKLPVYVVCTMRSDYIGQCSTFRGLPEYIGFSQFFVPRLKRRDLKQVIEEPALLSGNRISQRLIERLVFDISEGVDQLPILQHALSQIWMEAREGSEELDLIHYAMAGGMPVTELPDEDIARFNEWFNKLPEIQRHFYKETGLGKIIQIHANILYETAWDNYKKQHPDSAVTKQQAKKIIAIGFSCLTKIDNSRAVRNRMTLQEITAIINTPSLTTAIVADILSIFREEGNSFVRPFTTGESGLGQLSPGTVLDITHESLIRNWDRLNEWANREFEFYTTFLDFQKQLNRWKESGKSRGYLLPAGTLTYFENWYNKCKPNAGWIIRYSEAHEDGQLALTHANQTLHDTREFLKRSARKEMVTRTFMKYGPQRIATVFAILVMLVLSGFYWYDADQKKNNRVIERVKRESLGLMNSNYVNPGSKAIFLLAEERLKTGSLIPYLDSQSYKNRVSLANEVYKTILYTDKKRETALKNSVFSLLVKDLGMENANNPEFLLLERNKFLIQLLMDEYYLPDAAKEKALQTLTAIHFNSVLPFFSGKNSFHGGLSTELNMAIQLCLTAGVQQSGTIQRILDLISPLSGKEAENNFNLFYKKGSLEPNGRQPSDFNGGYHTLACLYAVTGNTDNVFWCFEKLLGNNQRDYFEQPRLLNNHLNVIGYLYQYGHRDKVPSLLTWMNTRTTDNAPAVVLRNVVVRSGYISHLYYINIDRDYYRSTQGYLFPNLCLMPRTAFDSLSDDYDKVISTLSNRSESRFTLAMNLKRKAIYYSKYYYDRQLPVDQQKLDGWLDQAVQLYSTLDSVYLESNDTISLVYNGDGVRTRAVKRKTLFMYPDYRDGWFSWTYHTDYFFNYLYKKGWLPVLYKTAEDLGELHYWVAKAYEFKTEIAPETYSNPYRLPDSALQKIVTFVDRHPQGNEFDGNLLFILLANHALEKGDPASGMRYYNRISLSALNRSSDRYEYLEKIFFLNAVRSLCANLAGAGKAGEAIELANQFSDKSFRALSYCAMAEKEFRQHAGATTFRYLDSLYSNERMIDFASTAPEKDCRYDLIRILSEIGSKPLNREADVLLSEIPELGRHTGILLRVKGIAGEGNYYRALTSIPGTLTETQDLETRTMILLEACRANEQLSGDQQWSAMDRHLDWENQFVNFIPN